MIYHWHRMTDACFCLGVLPDLLSQRLGQTPNPGPRGYLVLGWMGLSSIMGLSSPIHSNYLF
jgi:hypothetical protein